MSESLCDLSRVRELLAPDPSLEERVTSASRPWEGRIFAVETDRVLLPDGTAGAREIVRHHGGAGVVAVRRAGDAGPAGAARLEVCLVRQWRLALGRVTLEIPAGKLGPGESGAACAARELAEETGLRAAALEPLVTTLGSPGFTNERTEVFLARGLSQHPAAPDPGELVRVAWLGADEALSAVRAGLLQDGKTVAGLLAARCLGML